MLKQIVFIILAIVVTAFVAEYRAYKKQQKLTQKHRHEVFTLHRDKTELEKLKASADQELLRAQFCIKEQEAWKKRAIQCYPEIERLVRMSSAKEEAESFLEHYPSLEQLNVTYSHYPMLLEALEAYTHLSDEAKQQTCIKFEVIKQKRDAAFADYVRVATEALQNADQNLLGIPDHLPNLTKIMEWFNAIPAAVRSEISGTIIISLSMKEANAKYLEEVKKDTISDDFQPEATDGLSKIFDAISSGITFCKKKCGGWFSRKISSIRSWAKKPLSDLYIPEYEDEDDEDEPENPSGTCDTSEKK